MERVTGIEPALSAWEAEVLPLNYTRRRPERANLYPSNSEGLYFVRGKGLASDSPWVTNAEPGVPSDCTVHCNPLELPRAWLELARAAF